MAAIDANVSLLCRVGTLLCALPLEHVAETMRPMPVENIPGAPEYIVGMSVVRGAALPVVSLAHLFAGDSADAGRLVVLGHGNRRVGVLVDEVVGVRSLPPEIFHRLPPLLRDAASRAVAEIGTLDGEFMVALAAARSVPEDVFRQVEAEALAS